MGATEWTATTRIGSENGGNVVTSYRNASTFTVSAGGVDFAYRELGAKTGVPVIFLTHLAAVLDYWDPRVVDGIADRRRVITFENRGVGASSGSPRAQSLGVLTSLHRAWTARRVRPNQKAFIIDRDKPSDGSYSVRQRPRARQRRYGQPCTADPG